MRSYNDGYLEHYGVKGMRWGVRQSNRSGNNDISEFGFREVGASKSSKKSRSPKPTRAEKKALKKQNKAELVKREEAYYEKKAERLLKEASSNDGKNLMTVRTRQGQVVMTGREFLEGVSNQRIFDISMSDVFAYQRPSGYELNESGIQRFNPNKD